MIHYTNKHTKWALCGRIPAKTDVIIDLVESAEQMMAGDEMAVAEVVAAQVLKGAELGDGICPTCEGRRERGLFCLIGHVWDKDAEKGTPCQCGELHLFTDAETIRVCTFDDLESATNQFGRNKESVTH